MIGKMMTIFFLVGSVIYLYTATKLSFGMMQSPHAGFLPTIVGALAVILAVLLLLSQLFVKTAADEVPKANWSKVVFILLGFVFYVIIFKFVGYFAATTTLLFYMFKIGDIDGWLKPLLLAGASSWSFYWLFHDYLAVLLP